LIQTYDDLRPEVEDQREWTLARSLRAQCLKRAESPFLLVPEEGREWTYAQMLRDAETVARNFAAAGAQPGDRIIIMGANSSHFIRTWFGCALSATVEVPLNTSYEGEFLSHQVRTVEARFAIVDDTFASRFVALGEVARSIERFWVVDTGQRSDALELLRAEGFSAEPWEELENHVDIELRDAEPSDLAAIIFTSGTTGPSKGVAMPHGQLYFFATEIAALTRLESTDRYLCVTPLFHANAQFLAVLPALITGGTAILRKRFSASRWIDQVREHDVTVTNFLGVMMSFVAKQPRRPDDGVNNLRVIFAAPTASTLTNEFLERFGLEAIVEAFGLTETSSPFLTPYGAPRPAGAVGLLAADWFDARLVDPETDREVELGEVGELVVRTRHPWTCSMGYFNMPEKTVEAWRNLWFHTGDALWQDGDGWYYFVDRFKDALRHRGHNISSYEVEQAILGLEGVMDCAVIGVPSEFEGGEDDVLAVVVAGDQVDASSLWTWCEGKVPDYAVPRYVRFVDTLPKTPTEKIQKTALRTEGITPETVDRLGGPA
jgi:crotonobetaine/carnitine-CoA ligase